MQQPVKFEDYLNQAWRDHAAQPAQVAEHISHGIQLIEKGEQIPAMAQLIAHVFGEHLGRWSEGISNLQELRKLPVFESQSEGDQAIDRLVASLRLAAGEKVSVSDRSDSDQVRVFAAAASALVGQKDARGAQGFFLKALAKAERLAKEDPANRAMAVTGNNLSSELEEKPDRSPAEAELMILAATTARKFWEIAGTWLQVERAEYRLSRAYLKAGTPAKSLDHARKCLEIVEANNAPALEQFFAHEALALAERVNGNLEGFLEALEQVRFHFNQLSADDQSWCEASLKGLS